MSITDVGDIKETIAHETGPPVARIRTRVILSTYGWLIKYFSLQVSRLRSDDPDAGRVTVLQLQKDCHSPEPSFDTWCFDSGLLGFLFP